MPYNTNETLPELVQKHWPEHAHDMYREAFNHAYKDIKTQVRDVTKVT